jgi:hypothetical protein
MSKRNIKMSKVFKVYKLICNHLYVMNGFDVLFEIKNFK